MSIIQNILTFGSIEKTGATWTALLASSWVSGGDGWVGKRKVGSTWHLGRVWMSIDTGLTDSEWTEFISLGNNPSGVMNVYCTDKKFTTPGDYFTAEWYSDTTPSSGKSTGASTITKFGSANLYGTTTDWGSLYTPVFNYLDIFAATTFFIATVYETANPGTTEKAVQIGNVSGTNFTYTAGSITANEWLYRIPLIGSASITAGPNKQEAFKTNNKYGTG